MYALLTRVLDQSIDHLSQQFLLSRQTGFAWVFFWCAQVSNEKMEVTLISNDSFMCISNKYLKVYSMAKVEVQLSIQMLI